MKQFLLFWVLLGGLSLSAQNVLIPDLIFKNKLTSTICADFNDDGLYDNDVDTNDDGEIQVVEALAVLRLKINNTTLPNPTTITDLTGINAFANVKELQVGFNGLSTFNYTLPNLTLLKVNHNQLVSIDVNGIPLLKDLDCANNLLISINLQPVGLLESLKMDNNALQSLNLEFVPELTTLSVADCQLNSLNLNVVPELIYLKISGNTFVPDVSSLLNLKTLIAANMGLTALVLSTNTNLLYIDISDNSFQSLIFPSLPNLNTLILNNCSDLVNISVTSLPELSFFEVSNAPLLEFINAKNGRLSYQMLSLENLNALQYICTDEATIADFKLALQLGGSALAQVNDYCSLQPGGNYNTITGQVRFDSNQNGCDGNDQLVPFVKLTNTGNSISNATFTNATHYSFYTTAVNTLFAITPWFENPDYFNVSPSQTLISFQQPNGQIANYDFCVSPNGNYPDAEITIAPEVLLQPGQTTTMRLFIRNKGNQLLNGQFYLNYESDKVAIIASSLLPTSQTSGTLLWNYTDLKPFETRLVEIDVDVNDSNQIPAVNVGDELQFSVGITPIQEAQPIDNSLIYTSEVVGTYEPNNLICLQGTQLPVSAVGSYLHYMINFENTGTAQAQQVVVRLDINPTEFALESLQVLETSAASYIRQKENTIEIFFPNLQVDTGGHGNVLMKIRSKDDLNNGDFVNGRADIFFDYSNPLDTGITQTVYQDLSVFNPAPGLECIIGPNPLGSELSVMANEAILKMEIYDAQGRLLQIHWDQDAKVQIDFSQRKSGTYFIKLFTVKGVVVKKIIKE